MVFVYLWSVIPFLIPVFFVLISFASTPTTHLTLCLFYPTGLLTIGTFLLVFIIVPTRITDVVDNWVDISTAFTGFALRVLGHYRVLELYMKVHRRHKSPIQLPECHFAFTIKIQRRNLVEEQNIQKENRRDDDPVHY